MKLVPYILELDESLETVYIRLKPTGKYKFVSGPTEELTMYVQHKRFIFKKWIHERDIKFLPERKTEVFKCGNKTEKTLNHTHKDTHYLSTTVIGDIIEELGGKWIPNEPGSGDLTYLYKDFVIEFNEFNHSFTGFYIDGDKVSLHTLLKFLYTGEL